MVLEKGKCKHCDKPAHPAPTLFRSFVDFLLLYACGIYELLRQRFAAARYFPSLRLDQPLCVRSPNPIIIITGATSGIGNELLHSLSSQTDHIISLVHWKDVSRTPHRNVTELLLDLRSRRSTEAVTQQLLYRLETECNSRPVVLVHCAAVYHPSKHAGESQSWFEAEETLLVNTFMPTLLTDSLSHVLSGIIWIGSSSQMVAPRVAQNECLLATARSPYSAYPLSKLLALAFVEQWCRRTKKPALIVHPGVVASNLYRHERSPIGVLVRFFMPVFAWNVQISAIRILSLVRKAGFFERLQTNPKFSDGEYSTPVYWDAVTMSSADLPFQIQNANTRKYIAQLVREYALNWTEKLGDADQKR